MRAASGYPISHGPTGLPQRHRGTPQIPSGAPPTPGGALAAEKPVTVESERKKKSGFGANLFSEAIKGMDYVANRAGCAESFNKAKVQVSATSSELYGKLSTEMEVALRSHDDGKVQQLLDSACENRFLGRMAPASVTRAAHESAARQLKEALATNDPKALKGAMVAAQRLHATDLAEYQQAAQRYAEVRRFPEGWNSQLVLQRKGGKFVATSPVLDKGALNDFQQLLNMTHRKVYTRDRKGDKVPDGFELVGVTKIENADKWVDYIGQRENIRQEIARDRRDYQLHAAETMVGAAGNVSSRITSFGGAEALDTGVNEVWLFHGTKATAAEKIAADEFKVNLAGSGGGTLYGRGIYLAENSSKSDEYAEPNAEKLRTLLLCRATLGRVFYTDSVDVDPRTCEDSCLKGHFHSVLGDRVKAKGTFREFILFDDTQVYVNYVLVYRRIQNK